MDYAGRVSVTIAVGIIFAIYYSRRTGWGSGGLVTPGLLAVQAFAPFFYFAGVLLLALFFASALRLLTKKFSLYGRERVGAALLIAIIFRLVFRSWYGTDVFWIGWVVPGLIAADIERQGALVTLSAVVSTSIATALTVFLMFFAWGHLV